MPVVSRTISRTARDSLSSTPSGTGVTDAGSDKRLDVRLNGVDLGERGADLVLHPLCNLVRLGERERARELQVKRDLGVAVQIEDGHVVDFAHAWDPERGGERLLAQFSPGLCGLDVDDDVTAGHGPLDRLLDGVGRGVPLADGCPRWDADDDVGEMPSRRPAHAQAEEDDRRGELLDRPPGGLDLVHRRLIHEHVDVLADQPRGGVEDEGGDEERGDRIDLGVARRARR